MEELAFPGRDDIRQDLLRRWSEPHRRYHDRRHLGEVLAALPADAPDVVVLAAWYHDAVYDPTRDDNESASAQLARVQLSGTVAQATVTEVVRLVLLTRTHEVSSGDDAGAMLSDADLAVLGAAAERYDRYARDIRLEYAHVGDDDFRRGRTQVLRSLLAHEPLYVTEPGRRRWESAARSNLTRELAALGAGGPSGGAAPPH
jgi:predicted metal-dependent HD superfamily phosphohydrolase